MVNKASTKWQENTITWWFRRRVPQQRSKNDDQDEQHKKNYSNYNDFCFAHKHAGNYLCNKSLFTHLFIREGYKIERFSKSDRAVALQTLMQQILGDPEDISCNQVTQTLFGLVTHVVPLMVTLVPQSLTRHQSQTTIVGEGRRGLLEIEKPRKKAPKTENPQENRNKSPH